MNWLVRTPEPLYWPATYVGAEPVVPLVDFSGGDPIFAKTVVLRANADAASYAAEAQAQAAIAAHANWGAAAKPLDDAIALWNGVISEAYKSGALTSTISSPLHVQTISAQFQNEAGSRRAALQTRRTLLFADLADHFTLSPSGGGGSTPVLAPGGPGGATNPKNPDPSSPNTSEAPPEALPAGMAVGWIAALAAVGFIFFRVVIMKRPL